MYCTMIQAIKIIKLLPHVLAQDSLLRGHLIYNFGSLFLDHRYYTLW